MPQREQDNLPYRSPITAGSKPLTPVSTDESNYDTLKIVFRLLEDATMDLYADFNAFNIAKDKLPADRAKILLHEIEVKQGVFDIVGPLVERVGSAIKLVDNNFKRRSQK